MGKLNQQQMEVLNDAFLTRAEFGKIVESVDGTEDQSLADNREYELGVLCRSYVYTAGGLNMRPESPQAMNFLECCLQLAYTLGVRDGTKIPDAFKE